MKLKQPGRLFAIFLAAGLTSACPKGTKICYINAPVGRDAFSVETACDSDMCADGNCTSKPKYPVTK